MGQARVQVSNQLLSELLFHGEARILKTLIANTGVAEGQVWIDHPSTTEFLIESPLIPENKQEGPQLLTANISHKTTVTFK